MKLPRASKLLPILAIATALTEVVVAARRGWRFASPRLLSACDPPPPADGSALITLAYIGGLAAAAFGGGPWITEIGAVYLGAALIAAASPTPGDLGAIEAALVAGIGLAPGPAGSAVLYRLSTSWLPVIPRMDLHAGPAKARLRMTFGLTRAGATARPSKPSDPGWACPMP